VQAKLTFIISGLAAAPGGCCQACGGTEKILAKTLLKENPASIS
jgi:hypothetical protein